MAAKLNIEDIFENFSEQGWNQNTKYHMMVNFLNANPDPADRTNEKLQAFLQNLLDEECGFNDHDDDEQTEPQDDLELK